MKIKLVSIKTQLIIFLSGFAVFLSVKDKDSAFLLATLVAVISAVVADSAITYFRNKTFTVTESSIISGLIISFVLSSDQSLGIFLLASLLAISSKHFIRLNKKHIFNPAAFGIFLVIIFLDANTQWKGTYLWYILVPVGLYFAYKTRKLEVLIGYALAAFSLFSAQALIQRTPFSNILGYLSYFYIFVMVIEPKTSPVKFKGKLIFGTAVASLIFIFTELGVKFDAELCALLILNMFVPLLSKIP